MVDLKKTETRSEEHTSELQSRGHLVCRLLVATYSSSFALISFPTRRSSELIEHLPDPVIDIRNMWRAKDKTRLFKNYSNVTYDYGGTIYCHCPFTGVEREMGNGGFEKDRNKIGRAHV